MVVFSPERKKPFKCKTILLFCPPDWELTEIGLYLKFYVWNCLYVPINCFEGKLRACDTKPR